MKKAVKIATGVPVESEKYGEEVAKKIEWVGIPVAPEFVPVSASVQNDLKRELGFNSRKKLVIITEENIMTICWNLKNLKNGVRQC